MKKFFPLIVATLVCIAVVFGYGFMYGRVADGIARTATARTQSETLSERDALIRSQQVFLDDISDDRVALGAYVAGDDDVIAIIEVVENTARTQGVTVAISTVNTAEEGWGFHEGIEVKFSASGTFANMMRFIAALEALPQASELEAASFEVSTNASWFGTFSILFVKMK